MELLLQKLEWNQASVFECTGLPELLDELGVASALPIALAYCEAQVTLTLTPNPDPKP